MNPYPIRVHFTRTPSKGVLCSMELPGVLGFPNEASALHWVKYCTNPEYSELRVFNRESKVIFKRDIVT